MASSNGEGPKKGSYKIQGNVEAYTHYVVQQLISIKGRGPSDVVAFIVKDWIGDHRDELKEYGIDVASWKARSKKK